MRHNCDSYFSFLRVICYRHIFLKILNLSRFQIFRSFETSSTNDGIYTILIVLVCNKFTSSSNIVKSTVDDKGFSFIQDITLIKHIILEKTFLNE